MCEILLLNEISSVANEAFDSSYILSSTCEKPVGVMVRSFNMHGYDLPESVLAVARAGAGVNNIPLDDFAKRGVVVFNTPGANANAVKELVLLALLMGGRKITEGIDWVKTLKGKGKDVGPAVEKGKSAFVGGEIKGKTLGVVGLGAIGRLVANDCIELGMDVMGYDPYISVDAAWRIQRSVKRVDVLSELYETQITSPCTSPIPPPPRA